MTTRERIISAVLAAFILVVGGGFLYYFFYARPMAAIQDQINSASTDVDKKTKTLHAEQARNKNAFDASPRLEKWPTLSMPEIASKDPQKVVAFQERLQGDYLQMLDEIMRKAGFSGTSFTITPKELPKKPIGGGPLAGGGLGAGGGPISGANGGGGLSGNNPQQPNGKKGPPPYVAMSYTVTATGQYKNILQAMETLYRAPVLHEIKNFTLEKPADGTRGGSSKDLKATFIIEAIQVEGADKRPTLMPASDKVSGLTVLADRDYQHSLLQNDMFFGKPPKPSVKLGPERIRERPELLTKAAEPTPTENLHYVLGVVRLVQIAHNGRRWEAFYYDQSVGGDDRRLTVGFRNQFEFKDKYGNVIIKGEVLNIPSTQCLFFKADDGHLYRWGLGQFLEEAVRHPVEVIAEEKHAILVKGLEEVPGVAVMSRGDLLDAYGPRPAIGYGFAVGPAGELAHPAKSNKETILSRNAAVAEKNRKSVPVAEDKGTEKKPDDKKPDEKGMVEKSAPEEKMGE
jgi:hypothetical protein